MGHIWSTGHSNLYCRASQVGKTFPWTLSIKRPHDDSPLEGDPLWDEKLHSQPAAVYLKGTLSFAHPGLEAQRGVATPMPTAARVCL